LVEFVPDTSISDEEAIEMIRQPAAAGAGGRDRGASNSTSEITSRGMWNEGKDGDADTLQLDENDFGGGGLMGGNFGKDGNTFAQVCPV